MILSEERIIMDDVKERIDQVLEYTSNTLNSKFDKDSEAMILRNSLIVIEMKLKALQYIITDEFVHFTDDGSYATSLIPQLYPITFEKQKAKDLLQDETMPWDLFKEVTVEITISDEKS